MAAETQFTANTGLAQVSTANSNLDGTTGAYSTVITGASNGTLVRTITIKAETNTTQGMVRLFVNGGGTTQLIAEVAVPAVTKSASDRSFMRILYMNYVLQSGYVIKASTQNSETFDIIAEGLDFAYYASTVRPESTNYTANTGMTTASAANSNLDGTGTVYTALTAGASGSGWKGCRINSITIKSTVSTTAGMVRLFVQNVAGTTTRLLAEVRVPAVTKSGTAQAFARQIRFRGGLNLQAGFKIIVSTQNAESFNVIVEGMDWKYPA